jgi:hypothetical protein
MLIIPVRAEQFRVQPDPRRQPVPRHHRLDIGENLRLQRIDAGPVRLLIEREPVQVRLDVAGRAGIGIVAPGAAHPVRFFKHDEIVVAGLLQADRHAEAAEAGADDGDFIVVFHWTLPKEGRASFLKKGSKKLLLFWLRGQSRHRPRAPRGKSFLVLFFKKEHFPLS